MVRTKTRAAVWVLAAAGLALLVIVSAKPRRSEAPRCGWEQPEHFAQPRWGPRAPPRLSERIVEVNVRDLSGAPVTGAIVSVITEARAVGRGDSDDAGIATVYLYGERPARIVVTGSVPGEQTLTEVVDVEGGLAWPPVTLGRTPRDAAIAGHLRQMDGSPVPGARVWVSLSGPVVPMDAHFRFLPEHREHAATITGAEGAFRLPAREGRRYALYVEANGLNLDDQVLSVGAGEVSLDVRVRPYDATRGMGAPFGYDLLVRSVEPYELVGRVRDARGRFVVGAVIDDNHFNASNAATTDEQGRFRFVPEYVPPFDLSVSAKEGAAQVEIDGKEPIDVVLPPSGTLCGTAGPGVTARVATAACESGFRREVPVHGGRFIVTGATGRCLVSLEDGVPTWVEAEAEAATPVHIARREGRGQVVVSFTRPSHFGWAFLVPGDVSDTFDPELFDGIPAQAASDAVGADRGRQFYVRQLLFRDLPDGTYTLFAEDSRVDGEHRERHMLQVRGDTTSVLIRFE